MPTKFRHNPERADRQRDDLHALGVLLPIRFRPVKVLPGRHPLGRTGEGMRMLRTRPYVPGEDNPRDIDRFSRPNERMVMEWEDEAQASIMLLADVSASMSVPIKAGLRDACLLQMTYSLWRSGDRVGTILFDSSLGEQIAAPNLRTQVQLLTGALARAGTQGLTDVAGVLRSYMELDRRRRADLLFVISDFLLSGESDAGPRIDWRKLPVSLRHNVVPVVVSFAVSGTAAGMIKFWDPERRQRRLVWLSRERIRRINARECERLASVTASFRAAGLDYMVLAELRDIYPELARLARGRRLRKH
ncbi:MAG TPA: hypothetical protein VFG91_07820 [Woeseiaceae bacterium]|nr:hypothetical protein [Woeseiaceae bacterium]